MNGDFEQEGMSKGAKIAIGVGGGIAVVALLVGGFLFIRSRAAVDEVTPPAPPTSADAGGQTPPAADGTAPPSSDEGLADYFAKNPPKLIAPEGDLQYDVEILMTDEEKRRYGYPAVGEVRYKWVHPDPESGSPAPIMLITSMPESPPDGDSDGIPDAEESRYGTDPSVRDTDGDGLMDGYEVYRTKTDPTKADTDGDGTPDRDTSTKPK